MHTNSGSDLERGEEKPDRCTIIIIIMTMIIITRKAVPAETAWARSKHAQKSKLNINGK